MWGLYIRYIEAHTHIRYIRYIEANTHIRYIRYIEAHTHIRPTMRHYIYVKMSAYYVASQRIKELRSVKLHDSIHVNKVLLCT